MENSLHVWFEYEGIIFTGHYDRGRFKICQTSTDFPGKKKGNCQITEPLSWRVFEPAWLVIRNINMLAVLPQQMIHGQYV